jgi:hypothetical protein
MSKKNVLGKLHASRDIVNAPGDELYIACHHQLEELSKAYSFQILRASLHLYSLCHNQYTVSGASFCEPEYEEGEQEVLSSKLRKWVNLKEMKPRQTSFKLQKTWSP